MVLQYKKVGKWKNYLFGERTYIVLSLAAKTLLAWLIFSGTLAPAWNHPFAEYTWDRKPDMTQAVRLFADVAVREKHPVFVSICELVNSRRIDWLLSLLK